MEYARNPNPKKSVKVYGRNIRVSAKDSVVVCRAITGKSIAKAKRLLSNVLAEKLSLQDGKYHTKAVSEALELLKLAESNAEFKGMDIERMLVHASAHRGFKYHTPRRFKLARKVTKIANLQIVLEER